MKLQRFSILSLLAAGSLLAVASCDAGGGGVNGTAGTTGTAGSTGTAGTAGTTDTGGTTGTAGSTDTAGTTGTAGSTATAGTTGTAGSTGTAGTTGTAGSTGTAGTTGTAGATGTAGSTGTGGSAPGGLAKGMSEGCGKAPADPSSKWTMHHITLNVTTSKAGSWNDRVYYIDIPAGYDPAKPYPILFGGAGCGGAPNTNASTGGFAVLPTNNPNAIQVGLGYLGSCFSQGGADNPELPFFDGALKEIEANYCVDKGKVFVGGYSSGGWLSYMLAFARGGSVVRGISPAAGGIATETGRPPDTKLPLAGLLLTGANDTANPATGATGSDVARDLMLKYNGCTGTDTVPWEIPCPSCACVRYTGCPAAFPVVRCRPPGQGHTDGGGDFKTAIWKQWMTLPPNP
jgi:poly(3-hydroxybutyrate) depolymerase